MRRILLFLAFLMGTTLVVGWATPTTVGVKPVPGGTFQRDDAGNTTTVSPFQMGESPVTRAQFLAVVGADPSSTRYSSGPDDPVQKVSWYQAIVFCNKLSLAEGLAPVYAVAGIDFGTLAFTDVPTVASAAWDNPTVTWTNTGYRLPTEAEYEWAAMGANLDALASDLVAGVNRRGYLKGYPGSVEPDGGQDGLDDFVWSNANAGPTTHPVGTRAPNELGLYDLAGNVWEWLWDRSNDPSGTFRVIHGGGWGNNAAAFTVVNRSFNVAFSGYDKLGFRVARR